MYAFKEQVLYQGTDLSTHPNGSTAVIHRKYRRVRSLLLFSSAVHLPLLHILRRPFLSHF